MKYVSMSCQFNDKHKKQKRTTHKILNLSWELIILIMPPEVQTIVWSCFHVCSYIPRSVTYISERSPMRHNSQTSSYFHLQASQPTANKQDQLGSSSSAGSLGSSFFVGVNQVIFSNFVILFVTFSKIVRLSILNNSCK